MNKYDEIIDMADEVVSAPFIKTSDIPKIDLYMEQVLSLLEQEIGEGLRNNNEPVFTKTMVNNYTKEGILPRPEKKKYNKSHIMVLTYIYILKQTLSIQEIKRFFNLLDDENSLEELYEIFQESMDEYREEHSKIIEKKLIDIDKKFKEKNIQNDNLKVMTFISLMCADSMINKIVSSKLLVESEKPKEKKGEV